MGFMHTQISQCLAQPIQINALVPVRLHQKTRQKQSTSNKNKEGRVLERRPESLDHCLLFIRKLLKVKV